MGEQSVSLELLRCAPNISPQLFVLDQSWMDIIHASQTEAHPGRSHGPPPTIALPPRRETSNGADENANVGGGQVHSESIATRSATRIAHSFLSQIFSYSDKLIKDRADRQIAEQRFTIVIDD